MKSNRVRTLVVSSFVALAMLSAAPSASAAPSDPTPPTFGSSGLTVEQVDDIIRIFLPGHCTVMGSVGCSTPAALLG
ncbi:MULTISPECIES: hypothetical protein [unclassified Rhodococcus (in: high G+C Gram-positive bacteria)]|uniref:hypothetical protein n=1 Tax=unclassified Rhodococcus (in: high G+C Gram-positive bacteria) TaxID=192944 RepID=UPI000B9BD9E8|nr:MULTISPECIES: hypothetical protein [unclassified Rhodococcus (in: high G+C Gram-positive bacteria)]OZE42036.1 hypothetical protein CH259_01110 [Rhodococcus sp. 05-2254-4]OZE43393.1 hypothetical protein CH261_18800 [Rhodococcus sp. 05-2254-3]OZE50673.1 hypothetical protein CH283_13515 [Rhodococcus sp. 05-2254-2]